jgi:hypothetical protein
MAGEFVERMIGVEESSLAVDGRRVVASAVVVAIEIARGDFRSEQVQEISRPAFFPG